MWLRLALLLHSERNGVTLSVGLLLGDGVAFWCLLLRELLETEAFRSADLTLPVALGKSIGGEPIVAEQEMMMSLLRDFVMQALWSLADVKTWMRLCSLHYLQMGVK